MNHLPYISILVPVYNVESYIARCLRSIMSQTYAGPMECIIVDDCGTDKSIEIAEKVIEDYTIENQKSKIKNPISFHILHHEHNRGLAAARNTAIEAARGEFIIHVDSDDWVEPELVEELIKRQEETDADIVSCNAIIHYLTREVVLEEPDYASKDEMMRRIFRFALLEQVIWRRLIRTSLYRDNSISAVEGVNVGEDLYTLPRLLYYAKSFAKCDKILYHYNCMNSGSYMYQSRQAFSYDKYENDQHSFRILHDFFLERGAQEYVNEINTIKANYIYSNFWGVLKKGEKEAYFKLCEDWETINESDKRKLCIARYSCKLLVPKYYYLNRMRVLSRRILKKITGKKINV